MAQLQGSLHGLWTFFIALTIGLIGYVELKKKVDFFPTKAVLINKCDHEGLREAIVYTHGNPVTDDSVHVSVNLGCGNQNINDNLILTADKSSNDISINIDWTTFDTLTIEYKKGLRIFTRLDKIEFPDSTLNIQIKYKEME